jgi:hypothetical protein
MNDTENLLGVSDESDGTLCVEERRIHQLMESMQAMLRLHR